MDLNTYQPPLVAVPTLADEQSAGERPATRPIGIWLLSGLHMFAGLIFLTVFITFLWQLDFTDEGRFWIVLAVSGVTAAFALATAVGMWLGTHWGWWLTAFYYVWAILKDSGWYLKVLATEDPTDIERFGLITPERLILLAIHALILGYLFKGTVRDFFRLQSLSTLKALLLLGFVAMVVLAAMYGASRAMRTA